MNWHTETITNQRSDCGQYSIAAYRMNGRWFYEAWHMKTHLKTCLLSADDAKAVCEAHKGRKAA